MTRFRAVPRKALGGVSAVRRELGAIASPAGVRGALLETAWVGTHVAFYPLGLLRERDREWDRHDLNGLRPQSLHLLTRDFDTAATPILMVHGMIDNRTIFAVLGRTLRRRGFQRVHTVSYPPTTSDIRAAARELAAVVEEMVATSGHDRIHIVGHSLGGLIARYYVQRLGGDERVHTLVTLGSPHNGSLAARLLPSALCRQLRPGSELFAELALPVEGFRTRIVAFWSDMDQLIIPHANARCDHPDLGATNVPVHNVGHLSLPIEPTVAQTIVDLLRHLTPEDVALPQSDDPLATLPEGA